VTLNYKYLLHKLLHCVADVRMYGTSWCECVFSGNKNGINNPSWIGSTPHTNLRSQKWETCYSDGSDICWDETKHNECGVCFFIMHPMKVPVYRNQSFVSQSMSWSMWTTVVLYGCTFGSFVADNTDMTIFYASRVSGFLGKTSNWAQVSFIFSSMCVFCMLLYSLEWNLWL
jgi:hypothetical protein